MSASSLLIADVVWRFGELSKIIRLPCPRRWETSRTTEPAPTCSSSGRVAPACRPRSRPPARGPGSCSPRSSAWPRRTPRRRRAVSRRRSATTTTRRSTPPTCSQSSHDTADLSLVDVLTGRGARRDRAPRAVRCRLHALGRRRLPARPLRRRDARAAPAGGRPHRPRDRDGAARGGRGRRAHRDARPRAARGARACRERVPRDAPAQGGRPAASWRCLRARSCSRPAGAASPRPGASGPSRRTPRERRAR